MRFVAVTTAALSLVTACSAQMPTVNCPSGEYSLVDASSRPATRNCETLGYLASPSPLGKPVGAISLDTCVQTCKTTTGCVSFGYSASNWSSCVLYSKRLIDMRYKQQKVDKGTVFSNQLCYRCSSQACSNIELIKNGGFEMAGATSNVSAGWWTSGVDDTNRVERSNKFVHDGSYAELFTMSNSGNSFVSQVLDCVVPPGGEYVFTAWFYNAYQRTFDVVINGNIVYRQEGIASDWVKATTTITLPPRPSLQLGFSPGQAAQLAIDSVSLRPNTPE